jgi:peptidoglycan hydrolase-like protein with peptidoglycan-binding domain
VLEPDDGFPRQRPEARSEVAHLQRLLVRRRHALEVDGLYGALTTSAVRDIQADAGLPQTGSVDDATWRVLESTPAAGTEPGAGGAGAVPSEAGPGSAEGDGSDGRPAPAGPLDDFLGDLDWLHAQEGHAGRAYWPGGRSGVTLDPGFDLGHQEPTVIRAHYETMLTPEELEAALSVHGVAGGAARRALKKNATLLSIRVSREQAASVMPVIAGPYWRGICRRFPVLEAPSTPSGVQTALLSLAFNRGVHNRGLRVLDEPLRAGAWVECARRVRAMQQDHELRGIRLRRRREADLIVEA